MATTTPTIQTIAKTEFPEDFTIWTVEVAHLDPFVPPQVWTMVITPDLATDTLIAPDGQHHNLFFHEDERLNAALDEFIAENV